MDDPSTHVQEHPEADWKSFEREVRAELHDARAAFSTRLARVVGTFGLMGALVAFAITNRLDDIQSDPVLFARAAGQGWILAWAFVLFLVVGIFSTRSEVGNTKRWRVRDLLWVRLYFLIPTSTIMAIVSWWILHEIADIGPISLVPPTLMILLDVLAVRMAAMRSRIRIWILFLFIRYGVVVSAWWGALGSSAGPLDYVAELTWWAPFFLLGIFWISASMMISNSGYERASTVGLIHRLIIENRMPEAMFNWHSRYLPRLSTYGPLESWQESESTEFL